MQMSAKTKNVLNDTIAKFQSGNLGPFIQKNIIQLPEDSPAPGRSYLNWIMSFLYTGDFDTRTFLQWKSIDRYPTQENKGKHGYILAPRFKTKTIIDKNNEDKEKTIKYLSGFDCVPVWGYCQTDGKPIAEYNVTNSRKDLPPLMDLAERIGISVSYGYAGGRVYGYYSRRSDSIKLGTDNQGTWFHELGHAIHQRVDTNIDNRTTAEKEVVAELTSCVLSEIYGHNTTGYSWNYINRHHPDDPIGAMIQLSDVVQDILDFIFEKEKEQAELE